MGNKKLKILHINTLSSGGAFTGVYRLHCALLKNGIESKILVRHLKSDKDLINVEQIDQVEKPTNLINRLLTRFGFPVTSSQKRYKELYHRQGDFETISFPFSDFDITNTKQYQECDIVHVHWAADFLDYSSFFRKCQKPVVITLRDLYPLQGIFHYNNDVLANSNDYGEVEARMWKLKCDSIQKFAYPLNIVGISNWITQESKKSDIHKHLAHYTIPNCININEYQILNKVVLRKTFKIPNNHLVISFVSEGIVNKRKGMDMVLEALKDLKIKETITVLTVGSGVPPVFPFHIIHRHLGHLSQADLNKVYGVSDFFVFPSREEALGNVMLEAMACGVPVIGTPVGGLLDVIKPGFNGLIANEVSSNRIKEAIKEYLEIKDDFNSQEIRNHVSEFYSEELVAKQYTVIYESIINELGIKIL